MTDHEEFLLSTYDSLWTIRHQIDVLWGKEEPDDDLRVLCSMFDRFFRGVRGGIESFAKLEERNPRDYGVYLKSLWWQIRRKEAHRRDGGACRICNSTDRLDVHHRTYENLWAENDEDLITLCRDCHTLFHEHGRLARPPASEVLEVANGKPF